MHNIEKGDVGIGFAHTAELVQRFQIGGVIGIPTPIK
jgi:hypothetical protein